MGLPLRSGFAVGTLVAMLRVLEDRHGSNACVFLADGGDALTVRVGDADDAETHRYSLHALFHEGDWVRYAEAA